MTRIGWEAYKSNRRVRYVKRVNSYFYLRRFYTRTRYCLSSRSMFRYDSEGRRFWGPLNTAVPVVSSRLSSDG